MMGFPENLVPLLLAISITTSVGCTVDQTVGDGKLSFVNDFSGIQIAYVGEPKSIDCEAVNHCSIVWCKDGILFPWTLQHAEEKGQELYFKRTEAADEGEYTCIVSNGEHSISKTTRLIVLDESRHVRPFFLDNQVGACGNQTAAVGETVRFSCEFFVGKGNVKNSYISWLKVGKNGEMEMIEDGVARSEKNSRNDSVVISSLEINSISEEGFGSWRTFVYHDGHQADVTVAVNIGPNGSSKRGRPKSLLKKIKREV